jgi:hypothetical protein
LFTYNYSIGIWQFYQASAFGVELVSMNKISSKGREPKWPTKMMTDVSIPVVDAGLQATATIAVITAAMRQIWLK